ncbi:hypothetical protein F6V25_13925 [Oryzomonas japonica]|uniref:Uncharacterized protein n=1 Tax=Oryzomonas japonica TaxID=2603858 RepID=A0A7J4ZN81_9BACT|nr:hypothetical protein [Oryzomonas japonica]KAB0664265.1 hypothetical protein F6V25_13925 [Oryzomonas japonica]
MAVIKKSALMVELMVTAGLVCCLAACMGDLVYRPEKKIAPAVPTVAEMNPHLPPMPDMAANNATLAGIDTGGIGVRDDVQIWIYTNYTTNVKRTVLMTMAKTIQDVMAAPPKTAEEAKNLDQSFKDAAMMLKIVRGLTQREADEMDRLLYTQTVNTPERLKAYLQYNLLLGGGTIKR